MLHIDMGDTIEILRFKTESGRVPFSEWIDDLDAPAFGRVQAYVDRMKSGNFGNSRPVGDGISELKVNFGPGYRVYSLRDGKTVVVLLCGGDKGQQQSDIHKAHEYARDYWRRK